MKWTFEKWDTYVKVKCINAYESVLLSYEEVWAQNLSSFYNKSNFVQFLLETSLAKDFLAILKLNKKFRKAYLSVFFVGHSLASIL